MKRRAFLKGAVAAAAVLPVAPALRVADAVVESFVDVNLVRGYEVYAYGYVDERVFGAMTSIDRANGVMSMSSPNGPSLPLLGGYLFPFDAEQRGYDMALFGRKPVRVLGIYA